MKSRLPAFILGSSSSEVYQKIIAGFSEDSYQEKQSDLLGKHFLEKFRDLENIPNVKDIIPLNVKDIGQWKKTVGGAIFELLVAEMLLMHNIVPFYMQVEMWKIPNSKIDFLLYHEITPIILSCKLSIAERWRQAAYEGMLLKKIYRQGMCFLISGNEKEVALRNRDLKESKIDGIDRFYTVGTKELVDHLNDLSKNYTFSKPEKIDPVTKFENCVP